MASVADVVVSRVVAVDRAEASVEAAVDLVTGVVVEAVAVSTGVVSVADVEDRVAVLAVVSRVNAPALTIK